MTDETWLRDGLADAVPPPPASPDRADGARARARRARRTTVLAVGGATASVLLAAGVVAVLQGGQDPEGGTDLVAASPYDVPGCADQPEPTDSGPTEIPAGAVSVRLCSTNEIGFVPPADALVTDVDALADAVNALPASPEHAMCTMDLGRAYQLVFRYADRGPVAASGDLFGCRDVTVGGAKRQDSSVPWERFNELLRAQREDRDPPADLPTASPGCSSQLGSAPLARPQELAVAVVCVGDEKGLGEWQQVEVSDADLATLRAGLSDPAQLSSGTLRCLSTPLLRIVGVTEWGDTVDMSRGCRSFAVDDAASRYWQPGPEAQAVLNRLVAEAG